MKKSFSSLAALTLATTVLLTGCASGGGTSSTSTSEATVTPKSGETRRLVIGSGPIGGAFYPIAGGIAALINEYVEGVEVSVQVTAGGVENTRMVGNGEVDLGLSNASQCYDASSNSGLFEGEDLKISTLGTLHSTVMQMVVLADSGIKEFNDLKGKKVAIGEAGGGAEIVFKELVNAMGWTESDIEMVYLPYDQAMDQLGDGLIDAGCVFSGIPASSITNLASRKDINLVTLSEETQAKWEKSVDPFLYTFETTPAGTYTGMAEDMTSSVQRIQLTCRSDMDEELAYEITKAIYSHLDELYTYHASATSITEEAAAAVIGIELNPGADKYFTEAGLK